MGTEGSCGDGLKNQVPTPKTLIHQKYGGQARYRIEEIQEVGDGGCPGLPISQHSRALYRCCLDLPGLSVVTSDTFTKKKDAERCAAQIAVEKLGLLPKLNIPTTAEEAWSELVNRISGYFSNKFLSSSHPLVGHIKVALRRMEDNVAYVPMSIVAACDTKLNSYCKIIDPKTEFAPFLVMSLISKAAALSDTVCVCDNKLLLRNKAPLAAEITETYAQCSPASVGALSIETVWIPCAMYQDVTPSCLCVSNDYYLDDIAAQLNLSNYRDVLISKVVGKSSSELRLYYRAPDDKLSSESSENDLSCPRGRDADPLVNKQASCLAGQTIYGDAILANVGYAWKSPDLCWEHTTLSTYHRLILCKLPDGIYKLSREAILAAELPSSYARHSWRGLHSRAILSRFCHYHGLSEPEYRVREASSSEVSKEPAEVCEGVKTENDLNTNDVPSAGEESKDQNYKCDIKISSRNFGTLVEYSAVDGYGKPSEATQHSSLKMLIWFCNFFKQSEMPLEEFRSSGIEGIKVHPQSFAKQFESCISFYKYTNLAKPSPLELLPVYPKQIENGMILLNIDGADSGVCSSVGSVICISYTASLIMKNSDTRYVLESHDEFEFEVGAAGVVSQLESCATQLSVDQSAKFLMELPPRDLILAAAAESAKAISNLSLCDCFLEFNVKVLRVTEPPEDRMEKALFSPPLSKQRVDFAVKHINDSSAATLVDFGCGSGSLLDSLLECKTTLKRIVGVDLSRRGLTRAAKCIHQRLSKSAELQKSIESAILYAGSITDYDSRVYDFDIATCLEVIEHMDEDQARLFGHIALEKFCPEILILSTPNFEYNPILQRASMPSAEDEHDEKPAACKFRNLDHKFEWTREQFQSWATGLAMGHGYSVEFSGVGGSGNEDPGFASQIAVFRRNEQQQKVANVTSENAAADDAADDASHPYELLWEWNKEK